jgi:hypothetical protein
MVQWVCRKRKEKRERGNIDDKGGNRMIWGQIASVSNRKGMQCQIAQVLNREGLLGPKGKKGTI